MDRSEIDRIVSRVLSRIKGSEAKIPAGATGDNAASESPKKLPEQGFPILKPLRPGEPTLITEEYLRKVAPNGGIVLVEGRYIITPAAQDFIRRKGIQIKPAESVSRGSAAESRNPAVHKVVALGGDHRGYPLKEFLRENLTKLGYRVIDVGTNKPESCDYPDFARAVAQKVAGGEAEFGIVIDSAGIGSAIAANKVKGIRAGVCWDITTAEQIRLHNNANVMCLGADVIAPARALEMAKKFLATRYEPNERYDRRLKKIEDIENLR